MSYSFTGASIPIQAKTISVEYFSNQAPIVVPSLSQVLTDALRDRFTSQTPLNLVPRDGDLHIEGIITGYSTQPVAIQGNEQAALNRLTVTVRVKFTNKYDEKANFEQTFSRFEDYPFTASLNSVQDALIQQIVDALVDDIFNKAVVNW
ncbi:MAG: LptE family protein [Bacteroidales bacterium]